MQKHENDFPECLQAEMYSYGGWLVTVAKLASEKLGALIVDGMVENSEKERFLK